MHAISFSHVKLHWKNCERAKTSSKNIQQGNNVEATLKGEGRSRKNKCENEMCAERNNFDVSHQQQFFHRQVQRVAKRGKRFVLVLCKDSTAGRIMLRWSIRHRKTSSPLQRLLNLGLKADARMWIGSKAFKGWRQTVRNKNIFFQSSSLYLLHHLVSKVSLYLYLFLTTLSFLKWSIEKSWKRFSFAK